MVGNKKRKGEAETLDIISCYSPAVGSVQYDLQEAKLIKNETLKELSGHVEDNNTGGTENITCPWQALREDLGDVIKKEESEHVTVITIGDMNFTWNEASRRANGKENKLEGTAKVRSKDWKLWAKVNMKMVNVLSDLMEEVVPTFYRVNSQDDKDMILARVEVRDMMVNNVGIMDFETIDRAPTNSEHWPIAI